MAVQPQTPYKEYTANGSTKSFALEFDCDNQDHLIVLVDDVEAIVGAWSLSNGAVVFNTAPENGKKITIQRNTPFERTTDYQSYNNSFRPPAVNNDFDRVWWKLQELGLVDWLLSNRIDALKNYVDVQDADLQQNINDLRLHSDQQDSLLQQNIENLKGYVDDKDDELRSYLLAEIQAQGVALDQLDEYYNYLMQRLSQIAVDGGWDASFVSYGGLNQKQVNDGVNSIADLLAIPTPQNGTRVDVKSYHAGINKGGGTFVWNAASTTPDDGGMNLQVPGLETGRWARLRGDLVNPFMFGAYGQGTYDDTIAIQKFFNYIAVNNVGTADASGDFYITSGVELNGALRPVAGAQQLATMTITGTLRLYAKNAIDTMLKLYNCAELRWLGSIYVVGRAVGLYHTSRTCRLGVHISRSNGAQFGGFKCDYFRSFGISLDDAIGNTSSMSLGKVFCRVCGSGARNASLVANYSAREDITVVGSPSLQRSKLKVDVLPNPEDISGFNRRQYFMRLAGKTYRIMETDYENSIVSVYPIITENTNQTGSFDYVFGGGVNIRGGDSGVQSFDTIVGQNCGIVVDMCSLYGPEITNIVAESNGIAIAVGLNVDSAMVSYNIGGFYMEGNQCDIFQHTSAASDGGYFIGAEYALNLAKIEGSMALYGIMKNGRLLNYEKRAANASELYALDISIDRPNIIRTYRKDTGRVRITPVGTELNRLFGYDSATIVLQGTGANGEPTGEYTFESRDSAWTVNESTQPITLSGFSGTAVVSVYCNLSTKNITVTLANPTARSQTQSVAKTTVPANSKFAQPVSVTGASLGNWVQAAYTQPTAGLLTNAYVSAANTVTVEFINPTAAPIALEAGSLKLKITKF